MKTWIQLNGRWTLITWKRRSRAVKYRRQFVIDLDGLLHVYFWPVKT